MLVRRANSSWKKPTAVRPSANSKPSAYTLIELLIVMAIIAALAGIIMALWPRMSSSTTTMNAAKVENMLLISRTKGMRDKVPTGVRLIASPTNAGWVTQLIYVQQPEAFTQAGAALTASSGTTVQFTGVDFTGGKPPADYPVQPGDYLEYNGGGLLHKIASVQQASLTLLDSITIGAQTANFRVIRQPRPVLGEEPVELSNNIVIDLAQSQNLPLNGIYHDIVFAPSGSVIGSGTQGNDKIILWVSDIHGDSDPILVGIQIGTGFIGGYLVDLSMPPASYFNNTRDPHASGM